MAEALLQQEQETFVILSETFEIRMCFLLLSQKNPPNQQPNSKTQTQPSPLPPCPNLLHTMSAKRAEVCSIIFLVIAPLPKSIYFIKFFQL